MILPQSITGSSKSSLYFEWNRKDGCNLCYDLCITWKRGHESSKNIGQFACLQFISWSAINFALHFISYKSIFFGCMAEWSPCMGCTSLTRRLQVLFSFCLQVYHADTALFNLQLQLSDNSDNNGILPKSIETDPDRLLSIIRSNDCDVDKKQCIADRQHATFRKSFTLNFHIAPINKPPQLVIQVGGTEVRYIDTAPDSKVPLLQIVELDFVVQILGKTELIFFMGERRRLQSGNFTILRPSLYRWQNSSKRQWSWMIGFRSSGRYILK